MSDLWLPRNLEARIRWLLTTVPAVVLAGPRRVGKTVVAKEIAASQASLYLDLQKVSDLERLQGDAVDYLMQQQGKLIVIDEVQRMPGLFDQIRVAIDLERDRGLRGGKFLLLGSVAGDLMRQSSEHLTGRVVEIRMHGLNRLEVTKTSGLLAHWDRGCFPESLLAATDQESRLWRRRYLSHQVRRELKGVASRISPDKVNSLLLEIARNQGNPFNASKAGTKLGISRTSIASHLKVLEDMMLVRKIPAHTHGDGADARAAQAPKYYICDSGLFHQARKTNVWDLMGKKKDKLRGASWEGFVIENLASVLPHDWRMAHYRIRDDKEIDLVLIQPDERLWAVEIKSSPEARMSENNMHALRSLNPARAFLVHRGASYAAGAKVQVFSLEDMMNEIAAHDDEFPPMGKETDLMPTYAKERVRLEQSLEAGAPGLPTHRKEFLNLVMEDAVRAIRESKGGSDKNARHIWSRMREKILHPFLRELETLDVDPGKSGFMRSLRAVLEQMLALKSANAGSSEPAKPSFAALCAYDLFVSLAAGMLDSERFGILNQMLSASYACKGRMAAFSAFRIEERSEARRVADHVAAHSDKQRAERLIEAELLVMLYSLLFASSKRDASLVWYPHAFWHARAPDPQFFLRAETETGLQHMLACLGEKSTERLLECLEMFAGDVCPNGMRRIPMPYGYLLEKLHAGKWGSIR